MYRRRVAAACAAALVLHTSRVAADPDPGPPPGPSLHFTTPSVITTMGGATLRLPPGYFYDEPTHETLDTEVRRLQESEVRLYHENQSLRESASGWRPGWWTLTLAALVGFAGGVYVYHRVAE